MKTMRTNIFASIFLPCVIALVLLAGTLTSVMYGSSSAELENEVRAETRYIASAMEELAAVGIDYTPYLDAISASSDNRVTYIGADGMPIFDSEAEVSEMGSHLDRPEIAGAISEGSGEATRASDTIGKRTYYFALRLNDGSVIRVANTNRSVAAVLGNAVGSVLFISLLMLAVSFIFALIFSERITKPINRLNLREPLKNDSYEELRPLLSRLDKLNRESDEQMKTLKKQRDEFEYITSHMSEGLVAVDYDGSVLMANTSARNILGDRLAPDGERITKSGDFGEAIGGALNGRAVRIKAEYGERVYSISVNPIPSEGKNWSAVAFIIDSTDSERAEEMRREFSANVSHELKTPLTSILGCAEIISNGVAKPEDIPRFADQIHSEANRLLTLIGDIIKLSRLDEQDLRAQFAPVDMAEVCGEAVRELEESAENAGVRLECECDEATLYGFRPVLHEMVYNLCDNAIKYNVKGGSALLTLTKTDSSVTLTVRDTGIGIAPENQGRVFERFYRVDKSHSRATGGTGLGLSIVKHGAALHNAAVTLESEKGKGTVVRIVFPSVSDKFYS